MTSIPSSISRAYFDNPAREIVETMSILCFLPIKESFSSFVKYALSYTFAIYQPFSNHRDIISATLQDIKFPEGHRGIKHLTFIPLNLAQKPEILPLPWMRYLPVVADAVSNVDINSLAARLRAKCSRFTMTEVREVW